MTQVRKKRQKRVLNRKALTIFSLFFIIVISIFKIPDFIKTRSLEDLGFSPSAISAIKSKGLTKTILDNGYYSEYLDSEVAKDSFKSAYLELYVYEDALIADDFTLYDKLIKKGYTKEETVYLFRELNFNELVPLLVFDKLENSADYISDCLKNRSININGSFNLDKDYLKAYENVQTAKDIGTSTVLVSKKFTLDTYAPAKLVPLSVQYASEGVELENEAYGAFVEMVDAMSAQGLSIYALSGYRSYESQKELYDAYGNQKEADIATSRAGFSEAQTGLCVTVVDSTNESLADFVNTPEYTYLKDNAYKFGFIIRYPENKTAITGYDFTPYQLRYVGKECAKGVYDSGLTWEEYYLLYLDA